MNGPSERPDVKLVFDLVQEGPATDVARAKDRMVGDAVSAEHPRSSAPGLTKRMNERVADLSARLNAAIAGTRLTRVEGSESGWRFEFGDDWRADAWSFWRLVAGGIVVSGDDDGQWFGLSHPVNAAERVSVRQTLTGPVTSLEIVEQTTDLRIHFGGATLEIFNTSCGYEGW